MIVYVAGPYTATPSMSTEANIALARRAALWLARREIRYICPHLNSANFHKDVPTTPPLFWEEMYLEVLRRCADAVLVFGDYASSRGTQRELRLAEDLGMPVFFFNSAADREYIIEMAKKVRDANGDQTATTAAATAA